jgi:hypothetical protein
LTLKRIYGIIIKINNSEGDTDMGLFKSKGARELEGIIREMKLNLENNYKSTAHEYRKRLGVRCEELYNEGKLSEKDYKKYRAVFEYYTILLKDYHH